MPLSSFQKYKYNSICYSILAFYLFLTLPVNANVTKQLENNTNKKYILVLNSYNKGYKWTDNEVQGIEDAFSNDQGVILHIEYMDTKLNNDEHHFSTLKNLYQYKYKSFKFDAIISTDDDALKFLRQYRSDLFPYNPSVIFCGVNNFNKNKISGFNNVTGVTEANDFVSNIELILKLHPKLKKLYVINDKLTTGKSLQLSFDHSISQYLDRLDVIYLHDLSMQQLKKKVSELTNDSVVFYLSFFQDTDGQTYTPKEAIPQISKSASVPIYGSVDYMLGYGIVGGMLKSSYNQGQIAAKLTKKILNGTHVNDVPVVLNSPNQYMFDYKQLQRFDLSQSQLPKDFVLINEPQTFYYKYKYIIFIVLAIFIILLIYIQILLSNIRKRVRAEKCAEKRLLALLGHE